MAQTANCYTYISIYGCIECAILSFERLLNWVKPKLDNTMIAIEGVTLSKQEVLLRVYDAFKDAYNKDFHTSTLFPYLLSETTVNPEFDEYMIAFYEKYNTFKDSKNQYAIHGLESFCSELLFRLTEGTGFMFSKGVKSIGPCWVKSCCWDEACKYSDAKGNRKLVNCERRPEWAGFLPLECLESPELKIGETAFDKLWFLLGLSQFNTGFCELTYGSNNEPCSIYDALKERSTPPFEDCGCRDKLSSTNKEKKPTSSKSNGLEDESLCASTAYFK